ncbi:MAG: N-(5'-phosphoribosyl)anthranilate isomerase [Cytophagaceae bacterium]|nr:N-(5'-phosphoribosyl)anthranilate isomerase [Cytophagaceae bacterium]
MLRTLVKISNVTNLSDARYCAGMGVEWLGFSMDEVPFEKYQEIRGWVSGVQIVGETELDDVAEITALSQRFLPDYLQVTVPELLPSLSLLGLPLILLIDVAGQSPEAVAATLVNHEASVAYFLLESSDDFAHLDDAALAWLDKLAFRYPILLGFGLREITVAEVLDQIPVQGIALSGGDELRPGYKDFGEMMDLLEAIETD